jgi:PKD repeat protein
VFAPAQPLVGQTITFTSTSTDSDGTIVHEAWDFNGDGVNDATGPTATWLYSQPGAHTVRLRVRDNAGVATPVRNVVVVTAPNRPPTVSLGIAPAAPVAGQAIAFTAVASDPEGGSLTVAWDLDHDGSYDDAIGLTANWTFPAVGSFVVAVRATDAQGASTIAAQTVTVRGAAPAQDALPAPPPGSSAPGTSPPGPTPSSGIATLIPGAAPLGSPALTPSSSSLAPSLSFSPRAALVMSPFPIVRIRGRAAGSGVVVDLLTVRAPRGAAVLVRCSRQGCPRRRTLVRAVSATTPVRLRELERRYSPGAVLEVYVSLPGRIGKYVRFTSRSGHAPGRADRCLGPGGTQPIPCPAQ